MLRRGRGGAGGRGRGQATGRGGSRISSFSSRLQRADSDTSSLSDISLTALGGVDLSKESSFMKV